MRVNDLPKWPAFVDAGSPELYQIDQGIGFLDTIFEDLQSHAALIVDCERRELKLFWAKRRSGIAGASLVEALYKDHFSFCLGLFEKAINVPSVEYQLQRRVGSPQLMPLNMPFDVIVFDKYLIILRRLEGYNGAEDDWEVVRSSLIRAVTYIEERMALHGLVPTNMYKIGMDSTEKLFFNYFGPVYPQYQQDNWFVWPWQVSEDQKVKSAVLTASLVIDIRNSTVAMSQCRSKIEFMRWIDDVVTICRSIVVDNGGVYDKEIGDGVVGHFTQSISLACFPKGSDSRRDYCLAALMAAEEISKQVKERTRKFERFLAMGVGNLGPAVGVHLAEAVWISKNTRVSAIGESVVGATRMAGNANAGQVVISNAVRTYLEEFDSDYARIRVSQLDRKDLVVKELPDTLNPFGYCFSVK